MVGPQYLKHLSSLLKVKIEKLSISDDKLYTCMVKNKNISGIINIVNSLLEESKSNLLGSDPLEKAEVRQWIEYTLVYSNEIDNNSRVLYFILNDLNEVLSMRTYLVSCKLTVADIVLYYVLLNAMGSLTNSEKEKYLNVSRWFDNLQHDSYLRQSNTLVNFNSNYLVSIAPVRH